MPWSQRFAYAVWRALPLHSILDSLDLPVPMKPALNTPRSSNGYQSAVEISVPATSSRWSAFGWRQLRAHS